MKCNKKNVGIGSDARLEFTSPHLETPQASSLMYVAHLIYVKTIVHNKRSSLNLERLL